MLRNTLLRISTVLVLLSPASALAQPPSADFAGLGFGVGFQFIDSLRADLVDPADVSIDDDNFLVVTRTNNVQAGFVFESHVTFQTRRWLAIGPYFSVTPGDTSDQLVKAVGMGALFELNRPSVNAETNRLEPSPVSFNIGIGVNVLFNATLLRPGFKDGLQAPATGGPPTVTRERLVLQLMTAVGF